MSERELLFLEGPAVGQFWPLCVSRPPYLLRCGATMLWEKWGRRLGATQIRMFCRQHVAPLVARRTGQAVNVPGSSGSADLWVLDGRWLLGPRDSFDPDQIPRGCCLHSGGRCVGIRVDGSHADRLIQSIASAPQSWPEVDFPPVDVPGKVLEYLWDVVDGNAEQVELDFLALGNAGPGQWPSEAVDQAAVVLRPDRVWIGPGSEVGPQAVLDARGGPIILGRNAVINPHTYLEGPAAIGDGSHVHGGKIRAGTAIGPECRVGGEVEASVFLGFSNKYHDGFIGHCVIGEWVNLGALTTNSDVKNNYHSVRVQFPQGAVDTGRIKVGAFLADHTKTGIGSLLPTGGTVGFASNIFGGGVMGPKMVPEFIWIGGGTCAEYRLTEAKHTAAEMCRRRNVDFGDEGARAFEQVFEESKSYRGAFLTAQGGQ